MKRNILTLIVVAFCLAGHAGKDSLSLPAPIMPHVYGQGWHKGLNMSLDLSVMAQFGKYARHGVGFGQRFSALYLTPLSAKSWFGVGGSISNINWDGASARGASLGAMFGYQFNEHWEAYTWVSKGIADNGSRMFAYPYMAYVCDPLAEAYYGAADRIGAALKYNVNRNFSFRLSVEGVRMPKPKLVYFDRYNYPLPQQ